MILERSWRTGAGLLLVLAPLLSAVVAADNEIFGCGGFIKSHSPEIDFSKIEVKLLTKAGALKDKTDCSSNGYYFLPIYDNGQYLLQLSHPSGWSFEQKEIAINYDGRTDLCSQGKDINFVFKGFGITGRVGVIGQKQGGAPDVHVELREKGKRDVVGTTKTDRFGVFSFSPVIPGPYVVRLAHDEWHFARTEAEVHVRTGNTELEDGVLLVTGFDLVGRVTSDRQGFANVGLVAFPVAGSPATEPKCTLTAQGQSHTNAKFSTRPLCSTASASPDGRFVFRGLAPGRYLVRAFFDNAALKFNVEPREIEVEVARETTQMPANFDVTGFDVSGRVLSSAGGKGAPHARVKLNGGAHLITANAAGEYVLENVRAGTYTIQVAAEDMQFPDHTVKISGSSPSVPDVVASAFRVCGVVVSPRSHRVAITKHASTFHVEANSAADGSGKWCAFLPSGKFSLEVLTSADEKQRGVQFFPLRHELEVNAAPLSGVTFSQLKATVSGRVQCLSDAGSLCHGLKVSLAALDGTGRSEAAPVDAATLGYKFEDVLPGKYELVVSSPLLCWEQTKLPLEVKSAEEAAPLFRQSGYKVALIASHAARMEYALVGAAAGEARPAATHLDLVAGLNGFCVATSGEYDVQFGGCHSAEAPLPRSFRTGSERPVTVTFDRHRNGFKVVASEAFQLEIVARGEKRVLDGQAMERLADSTFRHLLDLREGEAVAITPLSETLLFKPAAFELVGGADCAEDRVTFRARKGLILSGRVEPAIKDARIRLRLAATGEELLQRTDAQGAFRFGPIDAADADYELTAEKESYVFGGYDRARGLFKAHKLCEIVVTVRDEAGQPLSGVLVSVSGAESYRKNLVSGADGAINFHSLSPSEYFLKPMLKEYKFEPNSKVVRIADGETVAVELRGRRVAYSAFGTVSALNGDAFANVVLEAVSEQCGYHQEESSSEANGGFRIRGLQPGCEYAIRAKKLAEGASIQATVDRTIPAERVVAVGEQDVAGVNLIAISPIGFVDVAVRVQASSNEHYKSLRVALFRKGQVDNPVYNGRLEQPLSVKGKANPGVMVFFPRIPFDGKTYVVELTTTLSRSSHKYEIPVFQFEANRSSVFHEFEFAPEVRAAEAELNQNSIAALVLLCVVAFAFLKQDLFLELVGAAFGKVSTVVQDLVEKNRRRETKQDAAVLNDKDLDSLVNSINNDGRRKKAAARKAQ